jgi:hypothetical protein
VHEVVAVNCWRLHFGIFAVVTYSGLAILRFGHAEPVPERVLENRFYTVKLVLWTGQELYTLAFSSSTIFRQSAVWKAPALNHRLFTSATMISMSLLPFSAIPSFFFHKLAAAADLHENNLQFRLCSWRDGQPAEAIRQGLVAFEVKTQLAGIEFFG